MKLNSFFINFNFVLVLILCVELCHNTEYFSLDENFTEDKSGRIDELDNIVLNDPDLLKAIAFSADDTTNTYKKILTLSLESFDVFMKSITDNEEKLNNAKYYYYILHNVKKYTAKWLTEEIYQLLIKTNENRDDLDFRKKRNIAEFIYFTASDYGVNLVMEGRDTSFNDWNKKHGNKKEETKKEEPKIEETAQQELKQKQERISDEL